MSDRVIEALVAWGQRTPEIRAMVLTNSRARADGPIDEFSDYDLILAVTDPNRFAHGDLAWQSAIGGPLVRWGDEAELLGHPTFFRGVVYDDHVKVDYTIWPAGLLRAVAEAPRLPAALDHGYRVLLDKDGQTRGWPEPTFTAHVVRPPSETEYRAQVEEFWWDMSYVPKALHRGELFFVNSFVLEHDLKHFSLRRMLEWHVAAGRDWRFAPGPHGRRLERHLDPDMRQALAETYAGLDADAIWDAVLRLAALYRRVAIEVAGALGYEYPQEIDDRMTAHLAEVRARDR
jgi:aminoglycoside 6-adenylyltransferase